MMQDPGEISPGFFVAPTVFIDAGWRLGVCDLPCSATASKRAMDLKEWVRLPSRKSPLGFFRIGTWLKTKKLHRLEVSLFTKPAALDLSCRAAAPRTRLCGRNQAMRHIRRNSAGCMNGGMHRPVDEIPGASVRRAAPQGKLCDLRPPAPPNFRGGLIQR